MQLKTRSTNTGNIYLYLISVPLHCKIENNIRTLVSCDIINFWSFGWWPNSPFWFNLLFSLKFFIISLAGQLSPYHIELETGPLSYSHVPARTHSFAAQHQKNRLIWEPFPSSPNSDALSAWNTQIAILGISSGAARYKEQACLLLKWLSQCFLLIKPLKSHQHLQTALCNFPTGQGNLLFKLLGSSLPALPTARTAVAWLCLTWLR